VLSQLEFSVKKRKLVFGIWALPWTIFLLKKITVFKWSSSLHFVSVFIFVFFFSLDALTTKTLHLYPFCTWEKTEKFCILLTASTGMCRFHGKWLCRGYFSHLRKMDIFTIFFYLKNSDERNFLFLNYYHRPREKLALHRILVKCCKHAGCKTDDAQLLFCFFKEKCLIHWFFLISKYGQDLHIDKISGYRMEIPMKNRAILFL